jgi:voltage-gated potassium channel
MAGFIPGVSLPGWLISTSSANSALLNLRLLRILKFQRVLTNENTYMNFEMALGMKQTDVRPYQLQLARVVISIFTLVSVSTGLIYTAEHDANPLFTDYFTALYFGLTTLTTVGFGDITPVTFQGRIVVMASILAGVIVVPAQAASL